MVIRARSNIRIKLPVIELKQLSQLIASCAHLYITLCSNPLRSKLSELVDQLLTLELDLGLFLFRLHALVLTGHWVEVFVFPWVFTAVGLLQIALGDELEEAFCAVGEVDF